MTTQARPIKKIIKNTTVPKSGNGHAAGSEPDAAEQSSPVTIDKDAQDERLWESEFAASQDILADLAAQSRENRNAGRTKKIGARRIST